MAESTCGSNFSFKAVLLRPRNCFSIALDELSPFPPNPPQRSTALSCRLSLSINHHRSKMKLTGTTPLLLAASFALNQTSLAAPTGGQDQSPSTSPNPNYFMDPSSSPQVDHYGRSQRLLSPAIRDGSGSRRPMRMYFPPPIETSLLILSRLVL
jgi:hypothetical protein